MTYIVKGISGPGTILHKKLGRIQLHKLKQKDLKYLFEQGCQYVQKKEIKDTKPDPMPEADTSEPES